MARRRLCFIVESGVDVRLVEGLSSRFDLTIVARRIEGGVEVSHPPAGEVRALVGPSSRLAFARFARRHLLERRAEIDSVLVQGYSLAALAANVVGRATGTRTTMLVCSPVEAYYECRRASASPDKRFRRHELATLRAVARLNAALGQRYVVLSEHLADVVRRHGGKLPVEVIPVYGVDTRLFAPPVEKRSVLKARLGLPTEGAVIFFSSRIAPEKDSETLLAAVRVVVDRGRNVWVLHRSGGYRAFLEDARRFGVAERVIASDAVHPHRELPADYRAVDLCVQASRAEGLGFSALEALASGVPVIATAVGGLRETIVEGHSGWSYPVGDVEALAERIAEVLDDPAEAARRAAAGREMVRARYDADDVFDRFALSLGSAG